MNAVIVQDVHTKETRRPARRDSEPRYPCASRICHLSVKGRSFTCPILEPGTPDWNGIEAKPSDVPSAEYNPAPVDMHFANTAIAS